MKLTTKSQTRSSDSSTVNSDNKSLAIITIKTISNAP